MNIDNNKKLLNVDRSYLHFVHNIVQKQWIVNKRMVSFEDQKSFQKSLFFIEQPVCVNPLYPPWPSRTIKFIQKFERICYVRITEILRYDKAEEMCEKYGLQLAVIDNIRLLEYLKQMNMCMIQLIFSILIR
jgi:hypothetical protein